MNAINVDIVRSLFMPLFLGGTLAAAALAQRVEVVDPSEIRIMGSKTELLRTLAAAASVESAAVGVRSFIPKWRARQDSNQRPFGGAAAAPARRGRSISDRGASDVFFLRAFVSCAFCVVIGFTPL